MSLSSSTLIVAGMWREGLEKYHESLKPLVTWHLHRMIQGPLDVGQHKQVMRQYSPYGWVSCCWQETECKRVFNLIGEHHIFSGSIINIWQHTRQLKLDSCSLKMGFPSRLLTWFDKPPTIASGLSSRLLRSPTSSSWSSTLAER